MKKETRTVVYDEELRIEAYRFEGIAQPFPNHFHDHYVIGFVEKGTRLLSCKHKEYAIGPGHILLFHPGDSHACVQSGGGAFDYRGFNISKAVMVELAEEVTGKRELPGFSANVIRDGDLACLLRPLHHMVMDGASGLAKEENLLFLLSALIQNHGQPFDRSVPECRQEIERACEFIRQHFRERIYLDQICRYAGLSKSALLRAFTKEKGITPYRYLETVRVSEAKALLRQGMQPAEAAMETGFSDQSHFTNYFSRFIGLAPGVYRDIFSDRAPRAKNQKSHKDSQEDMESQNLSKQKKEGES